ncbi:MAG: hypothetical protein ACYDAN_15335 [Candidatus Limnocylindrales bacterium]
MRPDHAPRLAPLALALLVLGSSACSAAIPSSDVGATSVPEAGASQAPLVSGEPSAAASPSGGGPSASTATAAVAPASPSSAPTLASTPRPTPRPTPKPTAVPTGYQCASLLLNSDVRKATGLSDATLLNNRNGTPQATGQTYCPYLAQSGQVTIAAAVWTGASHADFLKLWDSVAMYSQQAPGIGSQAIIDAGDGVGLAIVGKIGVSIQIKGPSGVPAGVDALTACQTLLKLLARRI